MDRRASIDQLIKMPHVSSRLHQRPLDLTTQLDKLHALEQQLRLKEAQLAQREAELREREAEASRQNEERVAELSEKERLLNEILRRHDLPTLNGDLQRYLDNSAGCSTAVDSRT